MKHGSWPTKPTSPILDAIVDEFRKRGYRAGKTIPSSTKLSQYYLQPPSISIYYIRYYEIRRPIQYSIQIQHTGGDEILVITPGGVRHRDLVEQYLVSDPELFDKIEKHCK